MTVRANDSSAPVREEAPHATETTTTTNISDALKRRAQSIINDTSIDPQSRAVIRYGLEINDPWLPELVRRVDAGESIIDCLNGPTLQTGEEKVSALAELICRAGDEPDTKSAALLVLMANDRKCRSSKSTRKRCEALRLHSLR
jgi:hypothetical protein